VIDIFFPSLKKIVFRLDMLVTSEREPTEQSIGKNTHHLKIVLRISSNTNQFPRQILIKEA